MPDTHRRTNPRSSNRTLTEAEREQRRAQDRERLQQAAEQLLSSEGWQRWVRVRARNGLTRYSLNNQLLIALARPDATFVAGFRAWLDLGYCVRKGEKAIRILAPMPLKPKDDDDEVRVLFRAVSVFDASQVSPVEGAEPTRLEPPREPLTGDSHQHLLKPLVTFASSLGFRTSFEPVPGRAGGFCDGKTKRIVVDSDEPANSRVRTLVHEIAHALGVDYRTYSREQAEVIVDTVTFIVCGSVGLDVGGESIPYVAGWGEDGALKAMTEFVTVIDSLARQIEDVVQAGPEASEAA
ncbi:MAG: ArdC-like ssDNA-binding domain-containing protein [Acidimicrobiia bacterium]|jgi:hypothetical protein